MRVDGRRRPMRDQAGLDAGHDDGVPLATLRGVEREQLDAVAVGGVAERVGRPRSTPGARTRRRAAARGGSRAPRRQRGGRPGHGHCAVVGLDPDGRSGGASSTSWAHARSCDADVDAGGVSHARGERRARRSATRPHRHRPPRRAPGEAGAAAGACGPARRCRRRGRDRAAVARTSAATRAASSASSAATTISTGGPSARADTTSDAWPDERSTCAPAADDLRSAPPVRRQAHDLDAGQVPVDLGEQRRVGAVERVDGLRRVADEEEVAAVGRRAGRGSGTAPG